MTCLTLAVECGGPGDAPTSPDLPDNLRGGAEMADRTCSVRECGSPYYAKGYCSLHYARWRTHGDPTINKRVGPRAPIEERFWAKVDKTDTCWLWTGANDGRHGYGRLRVGGRMVAAYRVAYELLVGPIPDGLVIDHLCRVPACVRPSHLEPVTQQVNTLRGETVAARHAAKTHCVHGHEFTPENTGIRYLKTGRPGRTQRVCLECRRSRTASFDDADAFLLALEDCGARIEVQR